MLIFIFSDTFMVICDDCIIIIQFILSYLNIKFLYSIEIEAFHRFIKTSLQYVTETEIGLAI